MVAQKVLETVSLAVQRLSGPRERGLLCFGGYVGRNEIVRRSTESARASGRRSPRALTDAAASTESQNGERHAESGARSFVPREEYTVTTNGVGKASAITGTWGVPTRASAAVHPPFAVHVAGPDITSAGTSSHHDDRRTHHRESADAGLHEHRRHGRGDEKRRGDGGASRRGGERRAQRKIK